MKAIALGRLIGVGLILLAMSMAVAMAEVPTGWANSSRATPDTEG